MKLKIEMIPEPLWGMNLRSSDALGRYHWSKLRKSVLTELGPTCAICGSEDEPHGHEIWKYEENRRTGTATLVGIEITCRACHQIHHWGLTTRLFMQEAIDGDYFKGLIKHFCKVNACKGRDMKRHADESGEVWQRRSRLRWKVDWGQYAGLLRETQHLIAERKHRRDRRSSGIDFESDGPPTRERSRGDRAGQQRRYRERLRARRNSVGVGKVTE